MGVAGEIAFRRRCRLFSGKKNGEETHLSHAPLCKLFGSGIGA